MAKGTAMRLFKRLDDIRIRHKLLLSYSLIFILCLTLGSTFIYRSVRKTIEANIESELKNTTATILNMVNNAAELSIKNYLRAIAEKNSDVAHYYYELYQSGQISEAEALTRARNVLLSQTISKTGYIYCLNSQGIIVNHPHLDLMGADLSEHAFIQDQIARRVGYLEYHWKNPSEAQVRGKALYMTYFEPWDWIISASSYRDEFNALVNVDDFREGILSLKFGQTGYSYVIDVEGNLVVHPQLEGVNILQERDANGRYFVKRLIEQRSGKIVYAWKNPGEVSHREKLVIFNHIPQFDWIVASSSYLDEFYAPLKTVGRIFLFTVAIMVLLAMPLTLWISSTITNPLQELMQHFAQGAKGDISVRMQRQRKDEMGMLAGYFNSFMQQLEQSSAALVAEIEERKKAESAIRKSEAKYRELVQNANSIILRIDTHGKITFFNEFAQSFFGYCEADIIGHASVGTIIPEKDSNGNPMQQIMEQVARFPEKHGYYEVESMRRNGQRVLVAWTNKAVRDAHGRIIEYLCIGHDITEAKKNHQEMGRMRRYLQKIVDAMPSILVGVDLMERITQWNQEAQKLTGITETAARGRRVEIVMPGLRPHMQMMRRAIAEERIMKVEKVMHPALNEHHFADIMVYPIVLDQVEGVVIRVDDVTARVRMENLMVQTEKMMSVGGLAAGMAHEINNPLGAMVQNAQNILRRISPHLPKNKAVADQCGVSLPAIMDYLERREIVNLLGGIRLSGLKASEIVENMLNFSRKSESRKAPVHLAELLERTVSLAAHDYDLKKKYDFRRIAIERDYDQALAVCCVATEIEQVILNLLRNAAQATTQNEKEAACPTIALRLFRENNMAVIEVRDNGQGISEHDMKRVFEPFYTTKDVGIGTGLGLSVSYFIVTNNHNGTMEVQSEPGKGSCFIVRLPLQDGSRSRPTAFAA
jgi:PAS domain S-box-containing protein